jgi:hypothetical protein
MMALDTEALTIFYGLLTKRLQQGDRVYGDASFQRSPRELLGEIEEELLDLAGWAFPLWVRLQKLKRTLDELEAFAKLYDVGRDS